MPDQLHSQFEASQPTIYQIRVKSYLDPDWTDWFEGLTITQEENGDTLLTGPVADQAALYGLLKKVRDLGMSLVSVDRLPPHPTETIEVKQQINSGGSS